MLKRTTATNVSEINIANTVPESFYSYRLGSTATLAHRGIESGFAELTLVVK